MLTMVPPIIAHRGASAKAPENTLPAFQKACELGLKWVEFDVTLSKCGEVVVFHDDDLERTTTGFGAIISHEHHYLQTLDAGAWFGPNFHGVKIPTLREVLRLLSHYNVNANIEIKSHPGHEKQLVARVFEEVEKHAGKTQSILISSFSRKILAAAREHSATATLGFLMSKWHADWALQCTTLAINVVAVNQKVLTEARVKEIKTSERLLLSYTVNDAARAKKLLAWGVDAVFSDCPDEMLSAFNISA